MQKWSIACIALVLSVQLNVNAQDSYQDRVHKYIEQYRELAITEQLRSGIPASITLAQGIHETSAGNSELATIANNHFGIKCKKEWTGETFAHTDDAPNECFRKYSKAEDSYTDHSDYLSKSPRYAPLFKCAPTDYKAWASGLKKCGYATNPRYAQVLIKIIEDYKLQEYTHLALNGKPATKHTVVKKEVIPEHDAPLTMPAVAPKPMLDASVTPPVYGQPVKVNGLKAIYARKGDMPLEYAIKNNVRYERFLEINEIGEKPLPHDMFLYLEKKNTKGTNVVHVVKPGETLLKIAQAEGIMVKNLKLYNQLQDGEEPIAGTILELQKPASHKPEVTYVAGAKTKSKSNIAVVNEIVNEPTPVNEEDDKHVIAEPVVAAASVSEPIATSASVDPVPLPGATNDAVQTASVDNTPVQTYGDIAPEPVKEVQPEPLKTEVISTAVTTPLPTPEAELPKSESEPVHIPLEPDNIVKAKTEEPKTESNVGPPISINDIPEKKPEVKPVAEKPVVKEPEQPKVAEQPKNSAPKSELDLLKSKFDKVVYSKPAPVTPPPAAVTTTPATTEAPAADAKPAVKETVTASTNTSKFHTVKKGDTVFSIAKANGITITQLRELNGMDFVEIKVGQKLKVKP